MINKKYCLINKHTTNVLLDCTETRQINVSPAYKIRVYLVEVVGGGGNEPCSYASAEAPASAAWSELYTCRQANRYTHSIKGWITSFGNFHVYQLVHYISKNVLRMHINKYMISNCIKLTLESEETNDIQIEIRTGK